MKINSRAGVSRSATITIAYVMVYLKLSLTDAFEYVKKRRHRIQPNDGFYQQLTEYAETLKRKL